MFWPLAHALSFYRNSCRQFSSPTVSGVTLWECNIMLTLQEALKALIVSDQGSNPEVPNLRNSNSLGRCHKGQEFLSSCRV